MAYCEMDGPYIELDESQDDLYSGPHNSLFPPMKQKNDSSNNNHDEPDLFPTPPGSVSGKKVLTLEDYIKRSRNYRGKSNGSYRSNSVSSYESDSRKSRSGYRSSRERSHSGSSCSACSCSCCSSRSRSRSESSRRGSRSRSGRRRRTRRHTECSHGDRSSSRSPRRRHRKNSHRSPRYESARSESRSRSRSRSRYRTSREQEKSRERQQRDNNRIQSDHNYFHTRNRSSSDERDYRSRSRSRDRHSSETRSLYSRLPHYRERSRDRSYKKRSRSRERECRRNYHEYKQEGKKETMRERRIVYVGGIPDDMSRADLRRLFRGFGDIEEVNIHLRDEGDNYGFVTFAYQCDAYAAIESNRKDPYLKEFDLCFGGRREFCDTVYADLDGEMEEKEESLWSRGSNMDFDSLLKQTMKIVKKKK